MFLRRELVVDALAEGECWVGGGLSVSLVLWCSMWRSICRSIASGMVRIGSGLRAGGVGRRMVGRVVFVKRLWVLPVMMAAAMNCRNFGMMSGRLSCSRCQLMYSGLSWRSHA